MDNTVLYAIMLAAAIFMTALPFLVFMGLATMIGATADDGRLLITMFLASAAIMYLICLGAFTLVQKYNCGSVKNMQQVASNAGLATGIQVGSLALAWLIPGLRGIVSNLFPPDIEANISTSLGYAYFGFWGALFGTAIGGTLSGMC